MLCKEMNQRRHVVSAATSAVVASAAVGQPERTMHSVVGPHLTAIVRLQETAKEGKSIF